MEAHRCRAAPSAAVLSARQRPRPWLTGAILLLPVYLLYLAHFTIEGAQGTGYLQYDQASYMADARAYFASGQFSLTYGLPFSPDPATPRVYFQPLTLVLGLAWKLTGMDPGILYMIAGLALDLGCARVVIALFDEVVGLDRPGTKLGLLSFFWGGGVLTLTGVTSAWLAHKPPLAHMLDFDPFAGFWFLNLGRNLVFTTEAFYHLVFLGTILLVLRRRYCAALACTALLSASHPFTGLQLIAVLGAWGVLEHVMRSAERPPLAFLAALGAVALVHLGYYLWFLNHASAEYRSLRQQWSLPWKLPVSSLLAADAPVALLASAGLITRWRGARSLAPADRLLLVWFAVSLVLAKHDLLIAPVQPLHFTRGYIWTPLFLLGAPVLVSLLGAASSVVVARLLVPAALAGLLLLDNAAWFLAVAAHDHHSPDPFALTLTPDQQAVISAFEDPRYAGYLVVSQSAKLGYLATVYSPLRSWYSHRFSTPHATERRDQVKAFFAGGAEPRSWHDRPVLVVMERGGAAASKQIANAGFWTMQTTGQFVVLARPPPRTGQGASEFTNSPPLKCSSRRKIRCCSSIP